MVNILLQEEQTELVQSASAILPVNSSGGILAVDPPLTLKPGVKYLIGLTSSNPGHPLDSSQPVQVDFLDDALTQYLPSVVQESSPNEPLYVPFTVQKKAILRQVVLAHAAQEELGADGKQSLTLRITRSSDQMNPLAQVRLDTTLSRRTKIRAAARWSSPSTRPWSFRTTRPICLSLTPDQRAAGGARQRGGQRDHLGYGPALPHG